MKARRFFFYGTLIAGGGNVATEQVHRHLQPLGPAKVPGKVYAIPDSAGWYPALLSGAGEVQGQLYQAAGFFAGGPCRT